MASPSHVEFIDNAMFCDTMFALAYTDSDQKWLIREHLLSVLREFPSLHPTIDTFIHNDGTMVKLLKVEGDLRISHSLPLIHINIWIHEHYPHVAPMVQITLDPSNPIRPNHPFVDLSGVTTSSYLHTWSPFGYNIVGLAYNLVRLFSLDHPLYLVSDPNLCHPSYMSKMEGMDRLWWMLHYDTIALSENTSDEIEKLTTLQAEMKMRGDAIDNIITGLEHERVGLKQRVKEMADEADMLINWLTVNKVNLSVAMGGEVEDAFECEGGEDANLVMEGLAEDRALEDLMYALEKAHEKGAMSHEVYIKQIRVLAKDQFMIRAKLKKSRGPKIFKFLDLIL